MMTRTTSAMRIAISILSPMERRGGSIHWRRPSRAGIASPRLAWHGSAPSSNRLFGTLVYCRISPLVAVPAATMPIFQVLLLVGYLKAANRVRRYFAANEPDPDAANAERLAASA